MKKYLLITLVLYSLLVFASPGSATLYVYPGGNETDVGAIDYFIDSGICGNTEEAERIWVNATLAANGYSESYDEGEYWKMDYQPTWYGVTDTGGTYDNLDAFQLLYDPDFFVLKTGIGQVTSSHYLFENLSELNWAVINWDVGVLGEIQDVDAISHWGEAGGAPSVPEPATMLLLGTGLIGLVGVGRRKFKKS